ncbi:MAG TPA: response regulator [Geopsychrobacteraceae bacterium]|jgi:two-component system chemotaxis response regulator CheY
MAKRVLIVDDAQFMRELLRDIFEQAGWHVVGEAENGKRAVEQFQLLKPDLVTMDIVMPLRSGIDALSDIIAAKPDARVVMCSALGQESMMMEAVKAGAKDFIVKPFQPEQVLRIAARAML